jgi:NADPH-dependent ferric siderophore reductase
MCRPGNNLFHKARDCAAWQPGQTDWEDLGGDCTSAPAVAAWALNRLDAFVRGPGNNLFHKAWDGAHWQPGQTDWEDLGGDCTSDPAVATWGAQSARRLRHGSGEQCVP